MINNPPNISAFNVIFVVNVFVVAWICVDFFCWLFKLPLMGLIKFSKTAIP